MSYKRRSQAVEPNTARAYIESVGATFGNDPIFTTRDCDESSREMGWSKIEFLHSLALEPTPTAPSVLAASIPLGGWGHGMAYGSIFQEFPSNGL